MDKMIQEIEANAINTTGSMVLKKYRMANPFKILKSIKYEMGLKYPEYRPCLNKLNVLLCNCLISITQNSH